MCLPFSAAFLDRLVVFDHLLDFDSSFLALSAHLRSSYSLAILYAKIQNL